MSYRLTFSLASLILILGFVFASTPVLAHPNTDDTDTHATPGHMHPQVIVDVALGDADPTTDGLQALDLNLDSDNKDVKNILKARIAFNIAVTIPAGATSPTLTAASGSTPAFYGTFTKAMLDATDAVTVTAFNPKTRLPLTTGEASANLRGASAGWTVDPDNASRYTRQVKITLDVDFEYDKTKTDLNATPLSDEEVAARDAAKAVKIADGEVALQVKIKDGLLRSGKIGDPETGQTNAQDEAIIELIGKEVPAPIPVTATPTDPYGTGVGTVGGSDTITVKIDKGTSTETLIDTDFVVSEAPVDTTSMAALMATHVYANDELTVTPDATATEDSIVTIEAAPTSNVKLNPPVNVRVDRTPPKRLYPPPPTPGIPVVPSFTVVNREYKLYISYTGVAMNETIEVGELEVVQTTLGGTSKPLAYSYTPATTLTPGTLGGDVRFTPDAVGATVKVTLQAGAVKDAVGNPNPKTLLQEVGIIASSDTQPPQIVTLSLAPTLQTYMTQAGVTTQAEVTYTDVLRVYVLFGEPIDESTLYGRIARASNVNYEIKVISGEVLLPVASTPSPYDYEAFVDAPGYRTRPETRIKLKAGIADIHGNAIPDDKEAIYKLPTYLPVITATAPFLCATANPVTITNAGGPLAAGVITVSKGWKIATGTFTPTGGGATFNVVRNDVETPGDRSWLGEAGVTISVSAHANVSAAAKTYAVGPVITIPAGEYVVVGRESTKATAHLSMPLSLYLGDPTASVQSPYLNVQYWDCMPDLGLLFDTLGAGPTPGIGGGGLAVKQSPAHIDPLNPTISKGTVGISEVMWSIDKGLPYGAIGNLIHAREQWIELHNLNNFEVKVTLFDLIGTEAYYKFNGNSVGLGEIDSMGNHDINNVWPVKEADDTGLKGQDGNSQYGEDFKSMRRNTATLDKNYAHGDNQGHDGGKWHTSDTAYLTREAGLAPTGVIPFENLNYSFYGSPGRSNAFTVPAAVKKTAVAFKPFIFNEIANRRDESLEWIEVRNVTDSERDLRNYQISIVTAKGTDEAFYTFPNTDIKVAAKGMLLLVDTDPRANAAHPLAVGYNIHGGTDQARGLRADAPHYMVANFKQGGLPDDGKFVLVLRAPEAADKPGTATPGNDTRVIDLAGWDDDLADTSLYTQLWPLKIYGAPNNQNALEAETVHRRQHEGKDITAGGNAGEVAFADSGYTGVGYKRHAQRNAAHGGTPGYTDIRKDFVDKADEPTKSVGVGTVTISEIMFAQGDGNYPQWIELYNSSATEAINLHAGNGWQVRIQNYDDVKDDDVTVAIPEARLSGTLNFKHSDVQTLLPEQTVMITSTRARSSGSAFSDTRLVFPPTRVFSVWDDQRTELGMTRAHHPILSEKGFYIEVLDGEGVVSDAAGNLKDEPNRRIVADKAWELSAVTGEMMPGQPRSSILRNYANIAANAGIMADGWHLASKTGFLHVPNTWYGHPDDMGSPGITAGGVLPVSLSKFRPERLDDGSIVIRWITESELNNAGFNLLRSETATGQFTQINASLIAGQGTTSERTTYEWKDTTAKPNVVYYYQIQDVSLDGKVQTLRLSRLKGDVSAAGKLTTTWGELKALQ